MTADIQKDLGSPHFAPRLARPVKFQLMLVVSYPADA
jgi:hypothetical protein